MSVNRNLEQALSKDFNETWLEEPVLMFEGIRGVYQERFEEAQISNGNVYQLRLVDGAEQFVCLASGNYTNCSVDGNYMYLSSEGVVSRWNLTTLETQIVFSGEDPIGSVWGYENIVFFYVGDNLYHYYVPTATLQQPFVVENLNTFMPMSNQVVCVVRDNPNYWAAVAASGVSEDDCPVDPMAFSSWLNQQFELHTNGAGEVFQNCDVRNILLASGIESLLCSYIDIVNGQEFSEYNNFDELGQTITTQVNTNLVDSSVSPLVSVEPTIWNYPSNTYFSDNNYTGCTCH